MLGTARRVLVNKDSSTIIEGAGKLSDIKARVQQIGTQASNANSEYEKENFEKRRAALEGKVAVIKVGGVTETEIEEKKFRVDDAVAAVKAALDEGIVPGGGVTLVNLAAAISDDADPGALILKNALVQPFKQLMTNAGLNPEEKYAKVMEAKAGTGVDVNSPEKLVALKEAGIIDPARVTKEVVLNSTSIAGTAMTMGALVVDIPEQTPAAPAGGMDPSMMGMGM
jgi:chaperonin GroEL